MNRIPTEGLKPELGAILADVGQGLNEQNPDRGIETRTDAGFSVGCAGLE